MTVVIIRMTFFIIYSPNSKCEKIKIMEKSVKKLHYLNHFRQKTLNMAKKNDESEETGPGYDAISSHLYSGAYT